MDILNLIDREGSKFKFWLQIRVLYMITVRKFLSKNISHDSAPPCYTDSEGRDIQSKFQLQILIPRFQKPPPAKFWPSIVKFEFLPPKIGFHSMARCAEPMHPKEPKMPRRYLNVLFRSIKYDFPLFKILYFWPLTKPKK